MAKLFANSGDPNQTPRSVASYLGLHCLPVKFSGVSRPPVNVQISKNIVKTGLDCSFLMVLISF